MVFNFFDFNLFNTEKIEYLDLWDSNNSTNFKTLIILREPQVQIPSTWISLERLWNTL